MVVSPKAFLVSKARAFTLLEMLAVIGLSSLLLALLASMIRVGFWEVNRSSGRIEVVRRGRQAIDNVQRYLASACQPGKRVDPAGNRHGAIFGPDLDDDIESASYASHVWFWTAVDHLGAANFPTARELQVTPTYYPYEIGTIPGADGWGQDLVLRRFTLPAEPLNPVDFDTSVQPRFLARGLGVPDGSGGYQDGLVIRHLREGAIRIQVNVSSDLITDSLQRNKIEDATPMRIKMSSIFQLPFYNVQ